MKQQPATKFQEQFWILNRIAKNNTAYNIPVIFKLNVLPNLQKFNKVVDFLIHKYDVLLSEYSLENGRVMMCFNDNSNFQFKVSVESNSTKLSNGQLTTEILNEIHKPFDLSKASLFRIKIFEYSDTVYLCFVFHHIIVDLRSEEIFFKEFEELYNKRLDVGNSIISFQNKQYSTFASEHNEWLKSSEAEKMMKLWEKELPPINQLINLPINNPRLKSINFEGERKFFSIDKRIGDLMNQVSSKLDINNFTFCLSAYFILLHKITLQDRIVIGVPLSNRRDESNIDVFGCFVNIVPIDISFENKSTIEEVIKQVRHKLLFAHRKQAIPLLSMIEQAKSNRNLSYNPYFQTGFTFAPLSQMNLHNIIMEPVPIEKKGSQLDLFVTMWGSNDEFHGYIEYSSKLFSESMVKRIEYLFKNVIIEITGGSKYISDIKILPNEDKLMLQTWNNTEEDINTDICLHQQFEKQVLASPDEVALKFNGNSLTYAQLNKEANLLSHYLIQRKVKVEDIVAVSIDRSFELIISIIAIHKAGAAYLPLDSRYPKDRINAILEDGNPKLILSTSGNAKNLPENDNVIIIDDILTNPLSVNDTNPNIKVSSKNLAYLLFTSGSTGRPKGVMIEHHSVINKLVWMQDIHPIDVSQSLLLKTPITFDVSVWELFWWFFNGSSLAILPPEGEKDPKTIIESVTNNNVSTLIFVPSMFAPFVEYIRSKDVVSKLNNLKYIILIGEALSPQLVIDFNELRTMHFSPRLVNTYGPTEATVAVSYYNCPEKNPVERVFIGKPIYNTKLIVIDKNSQICPIGVPGELVISGENLARGYIRNSELNTAKFIQINDLEGKKIKVYRTGDIVKWDESGELDFIGRVDNQVKIRGYRIELGDIETKLLEHNNIETAVVIVDSNNEESKHLVAYVVLKIQSTTDSISIKKFLMLNLPEYMVPTHIVILDKMPLNSSEKIDRKALPKPKLEFNSVVSSPMSETEKVLSKIWESLLNIKNISVNSNFFDIGGNSLLVISMVVQIKKIMDIDIEPVTVMQFPNIHDLSVYMEDMDLKNGLYEAYSDIFEKALLRKANRISPRHKLD
jgi:amino acid adenylation domain-containing protein